MLVALLLLVYLVVGWRGRDPLKFTSGDDMIYLALSHSLESGSYRDIHLAGAPLHVKYPPVYPVWLMLVRQATGEHADLMLAANLGLVAISFAMLFGVARRLAGPWLAMCLILLLTLQPGLLWVGGSLYAEALFLLLSTGTLVAALRADASGGRAPYAAIALALLTFLTRSAGLALVLAVGVWLWTRRKRVELIVYGVASSLVVGGWFGWVAMAASGATDRSYARDITAGAAAVPRGPLQNLSHHVWQNVLSYATGILPTELSLPTIPGTRADNLFWLAVNLVLLTAGMAVLWRAWRAAAAYLLLYAGLLVAWLWPINRLVDPLVPLILLTMLLGAWRLTERLPTRARAVALGCLIALVTLGTARGAISRLEEYRLCDRTKPETSAGCYDPEEVSVAAASTYLREHSNVDDVVLSDMNAGVYYLSGRRGTSAAALTQAAPGAAAQILREKHVRYVLLTAWSSFQRIAMAQALLASCRELRLEGSFAPHALLLTPAPQSDSGDNACTALNRFIAENPERVHPDQR